MFAHIDAYAGDPILGLNEAFQHDPRPNKVNLSIGIYFDDAGRIPVLESVRRAEAKVVAAGGPKPYLPMEGAANFRMAVQQLLFGASHEAVRSGRIATIQSVGSSGGLKMGADFVKRWFPSSGVWVSDPTWDNHRAMFEGAGLEVKTYPYYDPATGGVRFAEMLAALRQLPAQSVVLLHAACHNPTGVDLSRAQWDELIPVLRERRLIPYLDLAYQGFGDGIEQDAHAVRALAAAGLGCFVANSFSKSMSVYGERCGALSVVCPDSGRPNACSASSRPRCGATTPARPSTADRSSRTCWATATCAPLWEQELAAMRERILLMRQRLHGLLTAKVPGRNFDYFLTQRGMFSYTGLSPEQVDRSAGGLRRVPRALRAACAWPA